MRDQSHEAVYLAFILTRFVVALGPSGSRFGSPNTQTIQRHALQDRVARRRSAGRHCFLGIEWIQPEKKEKRRQPWNPLYCNGHYRYSPKWLVPCFYCAIYDRSLVVRVVFSGSWYRDLRSCSVMRFFRKKESVLIRLSFQCQILCKFSQSIELFRVRWNKKIVNFQFNSKFQYRDNVDARKRMKIMRNDVFQFFIRKFSNSTSCVRKTVRARVVCTYYSYI